MAARKICMPVKFSRLAERFPRPRQYWWSEWCDEFDECWNRHNGPTGQTTRQRRQCIVRCEGWCWSLHSERSENGRARHKHRHCRIAYRPIGDCYWLVICPRRFLTTTVVVLETVFQKPLVSEYVEP